MGCTHRGEIAHHDATATSEHPVHANGIRASLGRRGLQALEAKCPVEEWIVLLDLMALYRRAIVLGSIDLVFQLGKEYLPLVEPPGG